jgi:CheY-like chemotaxis protein
MAATLLLADDSVAVQRLVERAFGEAGLEVVTVRNGRDAVDRITRDRPAVVLADANLADRNGYELASHVAHIPELAHIPVVLLTGAFDQVDERRVQAAGCAAVLAKPFEAHMARALVEDLLAARGATAPAQPPVAAPPPRSVPARAASSLDEYFDRLDEALAGQHDAALDVTSVARAAVPAADAPASGADAAVSAAHNPPGSAPTPPGSAPTVPAAEGATRAPAVALHEVFTQLLDAELGAESRGDRPVAPTLLDSQAEEGTPAAGASAAAVAAAPVEVSEALIEAVTARVIERLGDTYVRTLVSAAVRDAAERLVRETIDRISTEP